MHMKCFLNMNLDKDCLGDIAFNNDVAHCTYEDMYNGRRHCHIIYIRIFHSILKRNSFNLLYCTCDILRKLNSAI